MDSDELRGSPGHDSSGKVTCSFEPRNESGPLGSIFERQHHHHRSCGGRFGLADLYQFGERRARRHKAYDISSLPLRLMAMAPRAKRITAIKQYSSIGVVLHRHARPARFGVRQYFLVQPQSGTSWRSVSICTAQLLKKAVHSFKGEKLRVDSMSIYGLCVVRRERESFTRAQARVDAVVPTSPVLCRRCETSSAHRAV